MFNQKDSYIQRSVEPIDKIYDTKSVKIRVLATYPYLCKKSSILTLTDTLYYVFL
jgi:hypothetical protein